MLIAAILLIIAFFVPISSSDEYLGVPGLDAQIWWSGLIAQVDGDWAGANTATIWTLGIAAMSCAALLFYGLHGMKGMEFKWDWLVVFLIGIALIIFPILMLVYDSDPGYDTIVGMGPILVLISGIVCVVVFVLEKFMGD